MTVAVAAGICWYWTVEMVGAHAICVFACLYARLMSCVKAYCPQNRQAYSSSRLSSLPLLQAGDTVCPFLRPSPRSSLGTPEQVADVRPRI